MITECFCGFHQSVLKRSLFPENVSFNSLMLWAVEGKRNCGSLSFVFFLHKKVLFSGIWSIYLIPVMAATYMYHTVRVLFNTVQICTQTGLPAWTEGICFPFHCAIEHSCSHITWSSFWFQKPLLKVPSCSSIILMEVKWHLSDRVLLVSFTEEWRRFERMALWVLERLSRLVPVISVLKFKPFHIK